jgi:hypothetical protein
LFLALKQNIVDEASLAQPSGRQYHEVTGIGFGG